MSLVAEILPYTVVVLAAVLVVCAELLRTFGGYFLWAFRKRWTWVLFGVNLLVAVVVYIIARATLNIGPDVFPAFCVGILYPVLLRSRFTFFRPVGDKDDPKLSSLSLRVDEFYTSLQERCYREVDNAVAVLRTMKARTLAEAYTENQLLHALGQVIAARQVEVAREKDEKYLAELATLIDEGMRTV